MNEEYLPLSQAADYIGVSRVKLSQLVKQGLIPYETSELDRRVKLFRKHDLDQLKRPRPAQTMRTE